MPDSHGRRRHHVRRRQPLRPDDLCVAAERTQREGILVRNADGKGGYRVDAVLRRYLDIIHRHSLEKTPPRRQPLYVLGDPSSPSTESHRTRRTTQQEAQTRQEEAET